MHDNGAYFKIEQNDPAHELETSDGTARERNFLVKAGDIEKAFKAISGHGELEGDILLKVVADQKPEGLLEIAEGKKIRGRDDNQRPLTDHIFSGNFEIAPVSADDWRKHPTVGMPYGELALPQRCSQSQTTTRA